MKLEDIARLSNVSRVTVSRALNNHPSVRQETRMRIMKLIREEGYEFDPDSRRLRKTQRRAAPTPDRSARIALFPESPADRAEQPYQSYFPTRYVQGITSQVRSQNCDLLLEPPVPVSVDRIQARRILAEKTVDGILLEGSQSPDFLQEIERQGTPFVWLFPVFGSKAVATVDVDFWGGVGVLMDHLISRGHERIAMFSGPGEKPLNGPRRSAYFYKMIEAGLEIRREYHELYGDWFDPQSGYDLMKRLMATNPRPTAVFAGNDVMAVGALRYCQEMGINVPGEVSLVGFDDRVTAQHTLPPLTTVAWDPVAMGAVATSELLSSIHFKFNGTKHIVVASRLVPRQSVRDLTVK